MEKEFVPTCIKRVAEKLRMLGDEVLSSALMAAHVALTESVSKTEIPTRHPLTADELANLPSKKYDIGYTDKKPMFSFDNPQNTQTEPDQMPEYSEDAADMEWVYNGLPI